MANNFNLQLYPRAYRVKTIGVIVSPTDNYTISKSQKIFFENDAELNNSIILGIRCDNDFIENGYFNYGNGYNNQSNLFTITLKDNDNNTIVDLLPLSSLNNLNIVGGGNLPQQNFKGVKTIKRFFIKTQFDKGYLTFIDSSQVLSFKGKFYLTIFYLPNNTADFNFVD